MDKVLIVRS